MTDYPDDILGAAAAAHAEFADSSVTDNLTVIIAHAIMAERQRAAKVANAEISKRKGCKLTFERGAHFASCTILAGIMEGNHV